MTSYLELVPISAQVHRRQTWMTRFCIFLAVFLVTVIFGMADMELRSQKQQAIEQDGNWYVGLKGISDEDAALISARPEVAVGARYDVCNYRLDGQCSIAGTQTVVCGFDEALTDLLPAAALAEGTFPAAGGAVITQSVRERLGLQIGDELTLTLVDGTTKVLTITGVAKDASMLTEQDAFGVYLDMDTFRSLFGTTAADSIFYLRFQGESGIEKKIAALQADFSLRDDQIGRNAKLLAMLGQSGDSYMGQLYWTAGVLAALVLTAGVLMISGSLNSNVSQRITFFGILRCLGATQRQIVRFVRVEALQWCIGALPAGVLSGVVVVWGLCAVLKTASPSYFSAMPRFGVSWLSVGLGAAVGLGTVLLAAQAPARRAAKASPLAAVSGNADTAAPVRHAASTRFVPVETALGIHHAFAEKKNFLLMVGSFMLSIVLFLSFSTAITFMQHALRPLQPYTPDFSVLSPENTCSLSPALLAQIKAMPAVKRAYGRSFAYNVPATVNGREIQTVLVSYEKNQFGWAKKTLVAGSLQQAQNGDAILAVYGQAGALAAGDTVTADFGTGSTRLAVDGVLSDSPFVLDDPSTTALLICSEETFHRLTGQSEYTILDVQFTAAATDADASAIRALAGDSVAFSDRRLSNQEARGAFLSMAVFLYSFLVIIAMISAFGIVNSIAMSVSARMAQYGAMRAIGMGNAQLGRMIAAEAATYAGWGMILGCLCGLPLHRVLFQSMITSHWGTPWQMPGAALAIILVTVSLSVAVAVYRPYRRLCRLSAVETLRVE
jgi:putative ABC transport system permease protein